MFAHKMHILIHLLYAVEICSGVVCQLYLLSSSDAFCAPIEIPHVNRAAHFACYSVEAGLPSFYRLACSFRSKSEMNYLLSLHFLDYAEDYIAASLPVYRDSAKLSEEPSHRAPEKFALHHAVRLSAY